MRKFSDEERDIIRRLVTSDGYSRNLVNLIGDRGLARVQFVVDKKALAARLLFESTVGTPTGEQIAEMGERQDQICKMVLLYVALLRYLEKYDLAISYKLSESDTKSIGFGLGAVNLPYFTWNLHDESLAGLVIEYYDKEVIPSEELRELVRNNFVTPEEKRFSTQNRATWTAIWVAIVIGILSLAATAFSIYMSFSVNT